MLLIGSNFLIIIVVGLVMKWLSRPVIAEKDSQGMNVMKVVGGYKLIAWVFFGFITSFFLLFTFANFYNIPGMQKPELYDNVIGTIFFVLFYTLAIWMILYERNTMHRFNDTKIISQNIFGKIKEIFWKDVVEVVYSKAALQYYIKTKDNKIAVHEHMSGFREFKEVLESKVDSKLFKESNLQFKI